MTVLICGRGIDQLLDEGNDAAMVLADANRTECCIHSLPNGEGFTVVASSPQDLELFDAGGMLQLADGIVAVGI